MISFSIYRKFLEAFACAHVNDGFMEDNGVRMLGYFMNLQGSPLFEVKDLKDKGNGLFRQNYFDRAATCEACKLLGLSIGVIKGEDVQSISDLVVSLNSNLAACALKLEEYQAAVDLCSMILDTFPRNVKALFRRALAFTKLKRFSEAKLDLVEALVVEPRNKDVLRELAVVEGHLLMKENGKRVLEVAHVVDVDRNCKKHVHVSESCTSFKDFESVNMELSVDQNNCGMEPGTRKEETDRVNLEVTDVGNCGMDLGTSLKKNEYVSIKSILKFSKKGGGNSRLRIPGQSYQKLLEGRELSFYHKKDLSITTIRILNTETTKKRDTIQEICKKRRRRRCPKRGKSKTGVDMEEDLTSLTSFDIIKVEPDVTSCVSSSASSLSDNVTFPDTQILQIPFGVAAHDSSLPISRVTDNASLNCPKAQYGSNDQEPSLLPTSLEKCKMFSFSFDNFQCGPSTPLFCRYPLNHHVKEKKKRRIINYSQGDESPRHNVSTCSSSRSFSRKFLHLRGVSVSYCRYSFEAQLIKKRKEMFAHLTSCDRPLKKPTLIVNPILSLIAYSNNVIIKSDSKSQL